MKTKICRSAVTLGSIGAAIMISLLLSSLSLAQALPRRPIESTRSIFRSSSPLPRLLSWSAQAPAAP